jgi:AraC-like DNA-binding protein
MRSESGIPQALVAHPVLEGADLSRARAVVSDIINPHSLRPGDGTDVVATQYAARIGAVTLTYLDFGAPVEITALDVASCYCVQLPLAGIAEVRCGQDVLRASSSVGSVPSPVDPLHMRWSRDAAHLIVRISATAVHRHMESLLGHGTDEPLRPALGLRLEGSAGLRWHALLDLLYAEIACGTSATTHSASAAAIEELALNALLLWHPNNHWDRLVQQRRPAAAPYVRRAVEYATEHLAAPLTVAGIADIVGVSVRGLQEGFRRDLGCSPSRWIRDERLSRVRKELLTGDPAELQVGAVALRWGFSHLGRFAASYQERFGERPSETLAGPAERRTGRR